MPDIEVPVSQHGIAQRFGVSVRTVRRWAKRGMPKHKIPGSATRYFVSEVAEWVRRHGSRTSID